MIALLFLIGNLIFALFIFFLTLAFVTGAPFVPSTKRTSESMIGLAHITRDMHVYDLGAGDGRLLFQAAQKGANAIGFEINPFLVLFTKLKILLSRKQKNVRVFWKNFWNADFGDADIVFIYLLPWKMEKLEQKLCTVLKPGSLVVSNSFVFPHLTAVASDISAHVYVFRI